MKKIILSLTIMLSMVVAFTQNDIDAFRFSQTAWDGTARFIGTGGSFSAIGGDFSTLSTNPAGIGVFKKMEISFTPIALGFYRTLSEHNGYLSTARRSRFAIPEFGMVFSSTINRNENETTKWRMWQCGFGFNRIQDFNNTNSISGSSNGSSMATAFAQAANGTAFSELTRDGLCAWNTWLIDTIPGEIDQYQEFLSGNALTQNHETRTWGSINEMTFSAGANYNDKLFVGATIGVPILSYNSRIDYSEIDEEDVIPAFSEMAVYDEFDVSGVGINLKAGVIYQPVSFLRLGLALHTPTYYGTIKEKFNRAVETRFSGDKYEESYDNISHYQLNTPCRAIGSVGFIIAKRAFVNVEYELTDYGMMTLASANTRGFSYNYQKENQDILTKYGIAHAFRIGGELTVTRSFLIRLGYGYTSSAFKEKINDGASHTAAAGIGFRGKYFFCDLAYQFRYCHELEWLYQDENLLPTAKKMKRSRFVATFGIKL